MAAFDETRQESTFVARSSALPARQRSRQPQRRSGVPVAALLGLAAVLVASGWVVFTEGNLAGRLPAATVAEPALRSAEERPADVRALELQAASPDRLVRADEVPGALVRLLGREAVLRYLSATDFPRKAVATLDNLGRDHAPVAAWPVVPAPARFVAEADGTSRVVAPENGMRYWAFAAFVDSIDAALAVDLYRRMYPVLQAEFRDLGFANRSLHARVLEVIDLLLATPEPDGPTAVTLVEVKGPVPSANPWTRYEYADPALERLSSGQKILLRVGPDNRKVLKAKLAEFRRQLRQVSTPARQ